jgi:hypothetical protein
LANPELIYVEGYALGVIPVEHAWCSDANGNVIDNTWIKRPGADYFGVPIKTQYATRAVIMSGHYGVIDDWEHQWPILRAKPEKFLRPLSIPTNLETA